MKNPKKSKGKPGRKPKQLTAEVIIKFVPLPPEKVPAYQEAIRELAMLYLQHFGKDQSHSEESEKGNSR